MKGFGKSIAYLASIHIIGLLLTGVLRLALYGAGHHFLAAESAGQTKLIAKAFLNGLWFDNVIACYILIVPLVIVCISSIIGCGGKRMLTYSGRWMQVLWLIALAISAANIPYFLYFFKNINSSIWNWAEYGATTLGMLFGEPSYYPPMLGFLLLAILFIWLTNRIRRYFISEKEPVSWMARGGILLVSALCIGLCLFGIRGRMGYNPIKVSAAYYCEDAFLNQLGISPSFNLLTSTLDDRRPENRELHLMDADEALTEVQKNLGLKGSKAYPLGQERVASTPRKGTLKNVVIILMESMSANLTGIEAGNKSLTPFLDSLMHQSITFTQCYSAGNHTNHGIFSTLYSFPALMFRNLMKGSNIPNYDGLPTVLHNEGYRNLFFMTHEAQYDNMNAFLRTNGFDEIYSQEDYPKEKIVNSFGVQDDYLYHYANQRLARQEEPFFATLLSISNHPPYIIPHWFKPRSAEKEQQIVEYSDEALRQFFAEAKKQKWYQNTIFVLLGDHGKLVGEPENEMPECLNHIPLIFHTPGGEAEMRSQWCMQLDIQPTLLSMLGISAWQNNFGINLLEQARPYAIYTADNVIGARSEDHLLIYEPNTEQSHRYLYSTSGKQQKTETEDSTFAAMRRYLFSTLQTAQEMIKNQHTKMPEK